MQLSTVALWALLNDPTVQAAIVGVLAIGAAVAVRLSPAAKDYAQDLADLAEEVEVWVVQAEKVVPNGPDRLRHVLDQYEAWAFAQGITGRRGRVLRKYLPGLVEVTVKRVDPKRRAA